MNSDCTIPIDKGVINIRVGAIIKKGNKFLMAENQNQGYLYSVGGRIKFGETSEEAVKREVFEETGFHMEIEKLGFIHENYFIADFGKHKGRTFYEISYYYFMKTPADFEPKNGPTIEGDPTEKLIWVTKDYPHKMFPKFFRTELDNPFTGVKHIITDKRNTLSTTDAESVFFQMHPKHFEQDYIRNMDSKNILDEQMMWYKDFDMNALQIDVPQNVTFNWYKGDRTKLIEAVKSVDKDWAKLDMFKNSERIYCALVDNEIASFCIAEQMGIVQVDGKKLKIGGPGCVGTVNKFRCHGIGLKMVQNVSQILKEESIDIGWIHWTGVGHWYARLGYKTVLTWNNKGFIE